MCPCFVHRIPETPVGGLTLVSDGEALTHVCIDGQRFMPDVSGMADAPLPVFRLAEAWFAGYFGGGRPSPAAVPVRLAGTVFQRRVWSMLLEIPYGETTTYGALARRLAAESNGRMSAQAVGGAVGRNPVSVIVPCHRVVGSGGGLVGYAGGLSVKERLLRLEGAL